MFSGMFRRSTAGGSGGKSATSSPARAAQQAGSVVSAPCACCLAVQAVGRVQLKMHASRTWSLTFCWMGCRWLASPQSQDLMI
jgi:hypothetical protein